MSQAEADGRESEEGVAIAVDLIRQIAPMVQGIQVVAPYLHDHTALPFAHRITEVVGGYEPPPSASDGR